MVNRKKKLQGPLFIAGFLFFNSILILINLSLDTWMSTHYLFNYQDKLFVRGLIGTINRMFFPMYFGNLLFIQFFQMAVLILLVVLLIYATWKVYENNKNDETLLLLVLFFSLPFTISFFSRDLGRFDQLNYLITIIMLYLLRRSNKSLKMIILTFGFTLMTLIHEASLFLTFPLIILYYLHCEIDRLNSLKDLVVRFFLPIFFALIPTLIINVILLFYLRLNYTSETFQILINTLQGHANFLVNQSSAMVQFRSIEDNVILTIKTYLNPGYIYLVTFIVLLAILYISTIIKIYFNMIFFKVLKNKDLIDLNFILFPIILLLIFFPLFLSLVGMDVPRWIAMMVFNLYVLVIFISQYESLNLDKITIAGFNMKYIFSILIISSLIIGPIAANGAPIIFYRLVNILRNVFLLIFGA